MRSDYKRRLADELTDLFINYQFRLENPMPNPNETNVYIIEKYRTDHMFHARVDSLVAGVMHIAAPYIDEAIEKDKDNG